MLIIHQTIDEEEELVDEASDTSEWRIVGNSEVNILKLTPDDVKDEINYWTPSVFGYVIGANPPWNVISGYLKRVWTGVNLDKLSFLPNGIFIARFKSVKDQQQVLKEGHLMFDNKPVIIREWTPSAELVKQEITSLPIWVKLYDLDLKFWGTECLRKIDGLIGKVLKTDEAIEKSNFLGYARLLIEVQMNQKFYESIHFLDESGKEKKVKVLYDWLPVSCSTSKGIWHRAVDCRKKNKARTTCLEEKSSACGS
ncbi:uncharacterized protein LOC141589967 [Silene latifolia]|uniref:uncharacterized protein LOC141589967 n=1 Tax=Silene latifolia TaxID=37657 RepID=UPI003D76BE05